MKAYLEILLCLFASQLDLGLLQMNFPDQTVPTTIGTNPPTMPPDSTMPPDPSNPGSPLCECVSKGHCDIAGGGGGSDGSGQIQYRISNDANPAGPTGTNDSVNSPASSGVDLIVESQTSCDDKTELCCTPLGYQCGLRYPPVTGSKSVALPRADFGAYPWQGVVLQNSIYLTSGALIDHMHFLTIAHNFSSNDPNELTVRLGDWELMSYSEPLPFLEYAVEGMFIHPEFDIKTSRNNIAILSLASIVNLGQYPTIGTVCLPSAPITGLRCWVSGWTNPISKDHDVLRQVDLPIIDTATCQDMLRKTNLGPNYNLDGSSFICAGGENGKDACTGDSGAPLVCQIANQFYVAGLVAWGMDCGKENVPGVYVNIESYVTWIQDTTAASGFSIRMSASKKTKKGEKNVAPKGATPTVKGARTTKAAATSKRSNGASSAKSTTAVKGATSATGKGSNPTVKGAASTTKATTVNATTPKMTTTKNVSNSTTKKN